MSDTGWSGKMKEDKRVSIASELFSQLLKLRESKLPNNIKTLYFAIILMQLEAQHPEFAAEILELLKEER